MGFGKEIEVTLTRVVGRLQGFQLTFSEEAALMEEFQEVNEAMLRGKSQVGFGREVEAGIG